MSFHELRKNDLLCYQSDNLNSRHGFTTRLGGVSTGFLTSMNLGVRRGDTQENVEKNYQILGEALGFDPHKVVCAVQVHRDDVRTVTASDWGKGLYTRTDYEADALITNVLGTALLVYSADCGTLLLEDQATGAIGACHAGWRGTALGIAEKTVRAMRDTFGTRPGDVHVSLGPCISRCCFETDRDVPAAMERALGREAEAAITRNGEKYFVDLKEINRRFLKRAGIPEENIDVSPLCTACAPDTFWSHRRHGDRRGSLGAVIVAGGQP